MKSVAISRNQSQSDAIRRNQAHSSTDLLMKRLGEHLIRRNQAQSGAIRRNQAQSVVINGTQSHLLMKRLGEEPMRRLLLHHLMRRAIKRSSEVIRGPSEVHQRPIRGASEGHPRPIRGSSEGHQRVIRGQSEGHQRVIRGSSEANQRVIRGSSEVPSHLDLCLLGQPLECLSRDLGGARVRRWPERRFVKARLELRVAYLMRDAIKGH